MPSSLWRPRRPSATLSDLGVPLTPLILAPTKQDAERLARMRHGENVLVELVRQAPLRLSRELDEV